MGQKFHICLRSGQRWLTAYGQPDRKISAFFKTSLTPHLNSFDIFYNSMYIPAKIYELAFPHVMEQPFQAPQTVQLYGTKKKQRKKNNECKKTDHLFSMLLSKVKCKC